MGTTIYQNFGIGMRHEIRAMIKSSTTRRPKQEQQSHRSSNTPQAEEFEMDDLSHLHKSPSSSTTAAISTSSSTPQHPTVDTAAFVDIDLNDNNTDTSDIQGPRAMPKPHPQRTALVNEMLGGASRPSAIRQQELEALALESDSQYVTWNGRSVHISELTEEQVNESLKKETNWWRELNKWKPL